MITTPAFNTDLLPASVVTPESPGYDDARAAWHLLADQRPTLIVLATDAGDVAAAVRHARSRGLRVAVQGTGHGALTGASLDGALLIRTTRMNRVDVDPARRTARVGAGACWGDVIAAAAPHGLACLHGFSAGVGVAGYVLGGGLGWLARRYGLACDHVRSFEVVTAAGERLRVDHEHEPDLFWALRGGGGAGVIVTALELELVPLRVAYAGTLLWPMAQAGEVVHAYREWIAGAPDSVTSSLRLMHFPPVDELPEVLRGRALVQLTLASVGDPREGASLVAPLRTLGPEIAHIGVHPAAALGEIAGDPVAPTPDMSHARLLASVTPEVTDAFVALADPAVAVLELRHLGGALRRPASPGAAGAVDADALIFASGVPATAEGTLALQTVFSVLDTLGAPADRDTLLTFAGPTDAALPEATRRRLQAITAAYDPAGIIGA